MLVATETQCASMLGMSYTAAAMPRVNSAPRIVPISQYPPESWYSSSRRCVTLPSRVPPDGDLLELGAAVTEVRHRLAAGLLEAHRATDLAGEHAEQQLLAVDSRSWRRIRHRRRGSGSRTCAGSTPAAAGDRCLERPGRAGSTATRGRRPSTHAAAPPRGSSGHGATRWFITRSLTTTSQPSKNSGPVLGGPPMNDRVEHGVAAGRPRRCGRRSRATASRSISAGSASMSAIHRLGGVGGLLVGLGDDRRDRLPDPAHLAGGEQRARDAGIEVRRRRLQAKSAAV